MIKGKRKIDLTPDSVLSMISEYDIFVMYMPNRNWKLNVAIHSPFRKDDNPSFLIGNKNGYLYFVDFADPDKRGGCFDFVQKRFGISLNEALIKIDKDFGLGIMSGTENKKYKEIVSQYKQPEALGKRYSLIQVVTRKFTDKELEYWADYYQSESDLRANYIYSVKEVYLNRKRYPISIGEIRFAYFFPEANCTWKIYFPYREKKRKWISNVPLATAMGLENLCLGHNTLICKSLKDYMVCRKVYPYTCYVQNESVAAFSEETVEYINSHSKDVFYGGDSDEAGKAASYIVTQAFNWKHINPPDRILPECKDWSDWVKSAKSLSVIEDHFKSKELM